jgi:nicotinamide-nucleotide amidase
VEAAAADLSSLAARVLDRLRSRAETIATAESLTGGLVGATLTAIPGASEAYRGGAIVYATDVKATLLDVPTALLAQRGAVDPDVAIAMAEGVRRRLAATWGVALTGVAGPDPQDGKEPGLVYIAVAGLDGCIVAEHRLPGDRDAVRVTACREALHAVYIRVVDGE